MDLETFRASLAASAPPEAASPAIAALWWVGRGDWDRAHECAQSDDGREAAAAHAYLHRLEGDLSNARYWYARAGRAPPSGSLDAEWEALAQEFLTQPSA